MNASRCRVYSTCFFTVSASKLVIIPTMNNTKKVGMKRTSATVKVVEWWNKEKSKEATASTDAKNSCLPTV